MWRCFEGPERPFRARNHVFGHFRLNDRPYSEQSKIGKNHKKSYFSSENPFKTSCLNHLIQQHMTRNGYPGCLRAFLKRFLISGINFDHFLKNRKKSIFWSFFGCGPTQKIVNFGFSAKKSLNNVCAAFYKYKSLPSSF